jgi:hypothetical protein
MPRLVLIVVIALAGCAGDRPRHEREGDDFTTRCRLARWRLLFAGDDASPMDRRLDAARDALVQAEQAIRLDEERVEGHFFRAMALGRILELSSMPDLSVVRDLEAALLRAKELDRSFQGAAPLRHLAFVCWQAPPITLRVGAGPEVAEELLMDAIQLAPASSENHAWYAELLGDTGRREEARRHARMAHELLRADPFLRDVDRSELEERIARWR